MPPTDDTAARADLPLSEDIAEIHREVQVAVNEVKAARDVLAAKEARLDEVAAQVGSVSSSAAAYIADFRNPQTPEPAPIAPAVPAPVVTVETPPAAEGEAPAGGAADAQADN